MSETLISIIIPVYNAELYLMKCIDSIRNQTLLNWELILVNDGSTDKSPHICDEYSTMDSRIKVVHKKNGGVSSARNIGLSNAKGKYVTFIDSDDWIEPTYLEDFTIENITKENVLVIQGIKQFYPKWNKYATLFSYEQQNLNINNEPNTLYEKGILMNGCPVAKLFSKKILNKYKIRFNENISLNEDHLFCLNYILNIDEVITKKNVNYIYMYDFQVDSLTKIQHSSRESLIAAKELYESINRIIERFSLDNSDKCLCFFGPYQLIRGSASCFNEINRYKNFNSIIKEYLDMTYNKTILGYDIYSKIFIFFVNKVKVTYLYYIQLMVYNICLFLNMIKRFIKKIVPKKCFIL